MASKSDIGLPSDREQRERRATSPHHSESSLSSYLHFRPHSRAGSASGSYATPTASGATTPVQKPGTVIPRKESSASASTVSSRKESGGSTSLSSGSRKDSSASQHQYTIHASHPQIHAHTLSSSSSASATGSEGTPTPSASALRRALAGGNTSDSGSSMVSAGSKFSNLLHTLQPGSRILGSSHRSNKDRDRDEGLLGSFPPRSHSRAESAMGISGAISPAPSPIPGHAKILPSSTIRAPYSGTGLYVSTGPLLPPAPIYPPPPVPTGLQSSSPAPSTIGSTALISSSEKDNAWGALNVHVLPLFNRDPLRLPIEDLNALVRKHMVTVIARNPNKNKAIERLEADVGQLIERGMLTLNSKLAGGGGIGSVDDEKLLGRVVELWGFFWDQVLPYVEGVFLPLQTDPYLLVRSNKPARAPSPTSTDFSSSSSVHINSGLDTSTGASSTFTGSTSGYFSGGLAGGPTIDVRKIALRAFRDSVVLPIAQRLQRQIQNPDPDDQSAEVVEYQKARLEQMLLVLSSISTHTVSLTSPANAQTTTFNERTVTSLLRLVLYPPGTHPPAANTGPRIPSFLSGSAPRDRRGRVMRRSWATMTTTSGGAQLYDSGGRGEGFGTIDGEKEGRELLESLRSPNPDLTGEGEGLEAERKEGSDGEEGMGTAIPREGIESLGTGPGGWGAKGGEGVNGKRTAVYEDPELQHALEYEEGHTSPGALAPAISGRRPSKAEAEDRAEGEKRLRI